MNDVEFKIALSSSENITLTSNKFKVTTIKSEGLKNNFSEHDDFNILLERLRYNSAIDGFESMLLAIWSELPDTPENRDILSIAARTAMTTISNYYS